MKQHLPRILLVSLALGVSGTVYAQSSIPYIFTARPKNTFSAGLKIRSGGAKVSFGQLGTVGRLLQNPNTGQIVYDDGYVSPDAKSAAELASTTTFYNNGTRYRTYASTQDPNDSTKTVLTQTGDFVAYQDGQTRYWSYNNDSQVVGGYVLMHAATGATSEGGSMSGESKGSSGGFDLELNHEFGDLNRRTTWGLAISIGVNEISAKAEGTVKSTLYTITDRYSLLGRPAPTAPYTAPSYGDGVNENGDALQPGAYETTTPLASSRTDSTTSQIKSGADVHGAWKVKGAYYIARLGPSFRYQPARRFSIMGNVGPAISYIGSEFSAVETLVYPVVATPAGASGVLRKQKVMFGFYGELNAEFWFTYQTGLFAGVVYEHLGKFTQNLGDRTASIDVGAGTGFRFGIVTRF